MGYVLQKKERECIGAMRAIDGYKTVAILHDELMIEKVGGIRRDCSRVMNEAVAAVVPGMSLRDQGARATVMVRPGEVRLVRKVASLQSDRHRKPQGWARNLAPNK